MNGSGISTPSGSEVSPNPSGSRTCSASTAGYGRPVALSIISPTAMLSEFEYAYCDPAGKSNGWSSTNASNSSGGGAWPSDAPTASPNDERG